MRADQNDGVGEDHGRDEHVDEHRDGDDVEDDDDEVADDRREQILEGCDLGGVVVAQEENGPEHGLESVEEPETKNNCKIRNEQSD
jgi:hypothetical protein